MAEEKIANNLCESTNAHGQEGGKFFGNPVSGKAAWAAGARRKAKKFLALAMMAFALVSAAVAARDVFRAGAVKGGEPGELAGPGSSDGIYAVVFRGGELCPTCDKMEAAARELFAERASLADVTLSVIDYELPGNEHYLSDYDLYTTTVVLIEQRGGLVARWRNLDDSWVRVEETGDFAPYLEAEIARFRAEGA